VPAVSDSSPLILYAKSGLLDLLRRLFAEIRIPPAVYSEVVTQDPRRPDAELIRDAAWIVQTAAPEILPGAEPITALDPGEAEAIALALQNRPPLLVLLDDAAARRVARHLGLRVLGSAGVLVEAKRYGLLQRVGPPLARLLESGLYLSDAARTEILAAAGEAPN
jgi:predicted nucleic acid-binding protein